MAKKPGPGTIFYIIFAGLPVTAMVFYGVYLYYFHDYGPMVSPEFHKEENDPLHGIGKPITPAPPAPNQGQKLSLQLRIEPQRIGQDRLTGRPPFSAEVLVINEGTQNIRVVYTAWPSALLDLRVYYLGPLGQFAPEKLVPALEAVPPKPTGVTGAQTFRHLIATLSPGNRLSLPVTLAPAYTFTRPGKYRLEVQYDPLSYAKQAGLQVQPLGIYALPLQSQPLEIEVTAAGAAPEDKPAPAAGQP